MQGDSGEERSGVELVAVEQCGAGRRGGAGRDGARRPVIRWELPRLGRVTGVKRSPPSHAVWLNTQL